MSAYAPSQAELGHNYMKTSTGRYIAILCTLVLWWLLMFLIGAATPQPNAILWLNTPL